MKRKEIILSIVLAFFMLNQAFTQKVMITKDERELLFEEFKISKGIISYNAPNSYQSLTISVSEVIGYYDIDKDTQIFPLKPSAVIFSTALIPFAPQSIFDSDLEKQQWSFKRVLETGEIKLYIEDKMGDQYYYLEKGDEIYFIYQNRIAAGSSLPGSFRNEQNSAFTKLTNDDPKTMEKIDAISGLINGRQIRAIVKDFNLRKYKPVLVNQGERAKIHLIRQQRSLEGPMKVEINGKTYQFEKRNYLTTTIPVGGASLIKVENNGRLETYMFEGSSYTDIYIKLYQRNENKIYAVYCSKKEFKNYTSKKGAKELEDKS